MFVRGLLDLTDNVVGGVVVPPDAHRALRRRRPVPRGRGRQGHGDVQRHRQRGRGRVRLLARRRVRVGRQRRLRPQGDGASRPAARGRACAAMPACSARTPTPTSSPWSASATCRATCSATGCCGRAHVKLVAAFDHRHVFVDPDPDPAASFAERQRLYDTPRSSWADYDAGVDLGRRRRVRPVGQVDRGHARRCAPCSASTPSGSTPNELIKAILRAPVDLLWNGGHRHLREGVDRDPRQVGDRANDAVRVDGSRAALPDGRGGRQPRVHAARPGRVRARRRADLHRRDRQLGRRRLQRPRGQHQDPARRRDRRRAR